MCRPDSSTGLFLSSSLQKRAVEIEETAEKRNGAEQPGWRMFEMGGNTDDGMQMDA